jgi:hypothetical protein
VLVDEKLQQMTFMLATHEDALHITLTQSLGEREATHKVSGADAR